MPSWLTNPGWVVTTSKGTWFLSNSQRTFASFREVISCYYIQRYMIFKQFTTPLSLSVGTACVVTTSKGTWFLSNSQLYLSSLIKRGVVTTSKGTWFLSNSQQVNWLVTLLAVVTTSKGTWFLSNSQQRGWVYLWRAGCYYIQRYMIFKQFTTRPQKLIDMVCCYYIQRYMIFKQFTTSELSLWVTTSLLLHPKVHDF